MSIGRWEPANPGDWIEGTVIKTPAEIRRGGRTVAFKTDTGDLLFVKSERGVARLRNEFEGSVRPGYRIRIMYRDRESRLDLLTLSLVEERSDPGQSM